jgi:hypothetical protein
MGNNYRAARRTAVTKEIICSDATKLAELIRTKEVSPVEVRCTWIASRR